MLKEKEMDANTKELRDIIRSITGMPDIAILALLLVIILGLIIFVPGVRTALNGILK